MPQSQKSCIVTRTHTYSSKSFIANGMSSKCFDHSVAGPVGYGGAGDLGEGFCVSAVEVAAIGVCYCFSCCCLLGRLSNRIDKAQVYPINAWLISSENGRRRGHNLATDRIESTSANMSHGHYGVLGN